LLKNPIVVRNSKVPAFLSWVMKVHAITLFPFVFIRDEGSKIIIRHETIHFRQYVETLIIGFLLIYLFDFIIGLIKYREPYRAYYRIRFEQEAYKNDLYDDYLGKRKLFSWMKYKI
jgi:hypothetical protein